ncbi:poly [ADP-ribose] polymerase-like [Diabrotica virgifera virgifera]|uniref:Poly [ADP-ribose] polymerase n=1 Tax=Diabrotica virgifera virgifera TaxID=50390 RepID=A0ABM5IZA3_DIAVI|nr:poly [ADP-ribose] polymerase-like [Diabrotica virgifera virgifera]
MSWYWKWRSYDYDDYSYRSYNNWGYQRKPLSQHQSTSAASASRKYPYLAEYSIKSVKCMECLASIPKGALRLGVIVQDLKDDNKVQHWYDFECFFRKQRPKNTVDIFNFESLKLSDQNNIKQGIQSNTFSILPDSILQNATGQKRAAGTDYFLKQKALRDFTIEYAKTSRAMCRGCLNKILKNEVRISKKNYDTEVGKKFDGQDMWHHVTCFVALREDLGYFESADKLPNFYNLKKEDQDWVLKELYAVNPDDPEIKKSKIDSATPSTSQSQLTQEDENQYEAQNKILFDWRDKLSTLTLKQLKNLLSLNAQVEPDDKGAMLDRLADGMTFGALLPCKKCNGQLVFENGGYMCSGRLSEWAKCDGAEREPERQPFKVSAGLKRKKLAGYVYEPRTRIILSEMPSTSKTGVNYFKPRVIKDAPALYDMLFVIVGKPPKGKDEIKKLVVSMGGKVITKIDEKVAAIISTEIEVEKMNKRMQEAEKYDIHVVPDDFLDEAKNNVGKIADLIIEKSICEWGSDPTNRLPKKETNQYKSIYTKSGPAKVTIKLKGGSAVDPESNLVDCAHVYEENDTKYTVVLGLTDIQLGKNSYHKMQLLQHDSGHSYWIFQAWGRIGTNIGDRETTSHYSLDSAKNFFFEQYKKKTGNDWNNRHDFKKQPNMMYPIDVDFAEEDFKKYEISETPSVLPTPVQDLLKMIFDINAMQKLMLEFELDTQKMPLGKLSKAQMEKAFGVLSELQVLLSDKADRAHFIDASNRFYTFIPHSFGLGTPTILDNEEIIKKKVEMLNSLLELEIAYNLMQTANKGVDDYYKGLNTEIGVLDRNSREFRIIQDYVQFTHTTTHNSYTLIVEEVYTIKRQGEEERFDKFKGLHNHKLLWHGSRVTNFAGILSQGLRIAPAEAPNSGAMFGKGIYFADMVSKSANYCFATSVNPVGLSLLCDVALGNMYDRLDAENIRKLPQGMNSCRGLGKTHPNPQYIQKIGDMVVPTGKGVPQEAAAKSHLLYNEYIVYDVAQVNIKYLVKMRFDFKHRQY